MKGKLFDYSTNEWEYGEWFKVNTFKDITQKIERKIKKEVSDICLDDVAKIEKKMLNGEFLSNIEIITLIGTRTSFAEDDLKTNSKNFTIIGLNSINDKSYKRVIKVDYLYYFASCFHQPKVV